MPESELPWLVTRLPVYYHRSLGRGCQPVLVALVQKVGSASLLGTNWEVETSCRSMPERPQGEEIGTQVWFWGGGGFNVGKIG